MAQIFASEKAMAGPNGAGSGRSMADPKLDALQRKADASGTTARLMQLHALQRMEDEEPLQGKGLPGAMQRGMENASGVDLSDVTVQRNSSAPQAVGAHAYAQGTSIHLGPGQEKHLGHEAWHTVQQKQGRVQPTAEIDGNPINDSPALEREADQMGAKFSNA